VVAVQHVWEPLADTIHFTPSPNFGYGDEPFIPRAVVWHISEGSLGATLGWLRNPASNASAHMVVARDGTLYNLVELRDAAWANGRIDGPDRSNPIVQQTVDSGVNPNLRTYSIECVGESSHWDGGSLTQVQAAALTRITAYLCWRSKLTCDRVHILGHYQWDSVTRSGCPGFSQLEWDKWIARANALCHLWRGW